MALTSDDLNYLIFQYLAESGYGHSAFVFGNESAAKDLQVSAGDFCPNTLVDIVQKGIQYKELQTRLAANGSTLRAFTAAEILRSKHPSDLIKAAAAPATPASCAPSARPRFSDHKGHVYSLAWHPSEMVLASGAADAAARLYHVGNNPRAHNTCSLLPHNVPGNGPSADVTAISWSPQGNMLATVTLDGHMRIWGKNGSLHMCAADLPPLQGVQFSPRGEYLAAHAADAGMVAIWHATTGMLAADFCRHHGAVLSLCWLSDCSFATCGQDGTVHINRIKLLPTGPVSAAKHGQDTQMNDREDLARTGAAQAQGHLTVAWEQNMRVHEGHVNEVCASCDGMWLAVACDDGTVKTWCMPDVLNTSVQYVTGITRAQIAEGLQSGPQEEPGKPTVLQDPALGPQQLSHKAIIHSARFWHLPSKDSPKDLDRKVELGGATDASISSPALLATCSGAVRVPKGVTKPAAPGSEASIKIWDVSQSLHLKTMVPVEGVKYMHAVRWAPDGRHVTCTVFAPSVYVWCVRTGQIVLQTEMSAEVSSVEWCYDGSWLAVGMEKGVIELVPFSK